MNNSTPPSFLESAGEGLTPKQYSDALDKLNAVRTAVGLDAIDYWPAACSPLPERVKRILSGDPFNAIGDAIDPVALRTAAPVRSIADSIYSPHKPSAFGAAAAAFEAEAKDIAAGLLDRAEADSPQEALEEARTMVADRRRAARMPLARSRLNTLRVAAGLEPLADAYNIASERVVDILSGRIIDQYGYPASEEAGPDRQEDPVAQMMLAAEQMRRANDLADVVKQMAKDAVDTDTPAAPADPAPLLPDHRHEQGYSAGGAMRQSTEEMDRMIRAAAAMGLQIEAAPGSPGAFRVVGEVPAHLTQPPSSLEAHSKRDEFKQRWAQVNDLIPTGATLFVDFANWDSVEDWMPSHKPQSHRHTTAGPDWEISPGEVPADPPAAAPEKDSLYPGLLAAGLTPVGAGRFIAMIRARLSAAVVMDRLDGDPANYEPTTRPEPPFNARLRAMKANPPADGRPVARMGPMISGEGAPRVTFDGEPFAGGSLHAALLDAMDGAVEGPMKGSFIRGRDRATSPRDFAASSAPAAADSAPEWPGLNAIHNATALAELNAQAQEMADGFAVVSGRRPALLPPLLELPPTEDVAELVAAARHRIGFDWTASRDLLSASAGTGIIVAWPGKKHLVVDRESTPRELRVGGQQVVFNGSPVVPMFDPLRPDLIGSAFDAQGRMVLVYRHALDLAAAELRDARDPSGWDASAPHTAEQVPLGDFFDKGTTGTFQLVDVPDDMNAAVMDALDRAGDMMEKSRAADRAADEAAASVAAIPSVPTGVVPRRAADGGLSFDGMSLAERDAWFTEQVKEHAKGYDTSPPAPAPVLDTAALPDLDATVAVNPAPPEAPVEVETDQARRLRALAEINNVRARVGMKLHPFEGVEGMPKMVCDRILSGLPYDQNGQPPRDDRPYDSVAIQTTEATALYEFNARMRHEGKPPVKALPRGCPFGPLIEAARLRYENNGELAYHVVLPSEANMRHNAAIELLDVERIACGYGPFSSTDHLSLPPGSTENILAGLPFDRFGQPLDPKGGTDEVGARTLRKIALIELNQQRWESEDDLDGEIELRELPADADLKKLVADAAERRVLDEAYARDQEAVADAVAASAATTVAIEPAAPAPVDPKLGRIELPDEITIAVLADPARAAAVLAREFAPDVASTSASPAAGEEPAAPMTAGERAWQALDERVLGAMLNLGALEVVRLQITPEEEEAFKDLFASAKFGKVQVIEVADKPDEAEILARLRRMMAPYLPGGTHAALAAEAAQADATSRANLEAMNARRLAGGQPLFRLLPGFECVRHGENCFTLQKKAGTPASDTLSEFVRGNLGKPWVDELNAEIEQQDQTIAPAKGQEP